MLPSFSKLFASSTSATAASTPGAASALAPTLKSSSHTFPNGRIQDQPLAYTLAHAFDGAKLNLAVDAGAGHTAVTAYPSNHEPAAVPMKKEGETWTAQLHGFQPGQEVELHFVVENNGQQVDNSTDKHKITLDNVSTDPNAPVRHVMPNGLIGGNKVQYQLQHAFDGEKVAVRFDAGPGFSAVTAYPSPHEPAAVTMTQDGDAWVAMLQGFKEGDELDLHFVAESNGQQADNHTARHRVVVPPKQ